MEMLEINLESIAATGDVRISRVFRAYEADVETPWQRHIDEPP
jgi:hypothetical protein